MCIHIIIEEGINDGIIELCARIFMYRILSECLGVPIYLYKCTLHVPFAGDIDCVDNKGRLGKVTKEPWKEDGEKNL